MVRLLRRRQTKGSETARLRLNHRVTPRLHNSADFSKNFHVGKAVTASLAGRLWRRCVWCRPTLLLAAPKFWHGDGGHVSPRQDQEEGRQAASLLQRGGEPPRGAEQDRAADRALSRGDQ